MLKYNQYKSISGVISIPVGGTPRVFILDSQATEIALQHFCEATGWKAEWFIEDGKVIHEVGYHGSHSWFEKNIIRDATEEDVFLHATYRKMAELGLKD